MLNKIIILIFGSFVFAYDGNVRLPIVEKPIPQQSKIQGEIPEEVSYQHVHITDKFWRSRIDQNRVVGIRSTLKEAANEIDNFDIASGKKKGKHTGNAADDSDIFKIIQGAAYAIGDNPDAALEASIDSLIDKIVSAQQSDGYLFTYWIVFDLSKKWTDIAGKHELYCAGHLFEAATAYYQVTDKRKLLDAAIRYADYIDSVFGPGKRLEVPGHEEIELALYKLYKVTGEKRYLNLAVFFVDERGDPTRMVVEKITPPDRDPNANTPHRWRSPSYMQDHLPITSQFYAAGHAVRAGYLYSAVTDISIEKKETKYLAALDSIWNDIVGKKMYITGGVGSRQFHDEGFGSPYLLPNDQAYCETCSGIAFTFWNRRMNMLTGDAKYADIAELTMYNTTLAGVSLSGDKFFYTNPLESKGKNERESWNNPACCPSNIVRFLPEIGSTIYGKTSKAIYINQFIGNTAQISMGDQNITMKMESNYPWDGRINLALDPLKPVDISLHIRIPGWASGELIPGQLYHYAENKMASTEKVILKVNGIRISSITMEKGYAIIKRNWKKGDKIELVLPMPIKLVAGNDKIESTRGQLAITRGPLVYCLEQTDNKSFFENATDKLLRTLVLKAKYRDDMLNGVMTINGAGVLSGKNENIKITAIPYYAWANREQGQMKVWLSMSAN
ncbi:MAG: beta-L-arabinofuranosidase domain-containing protein [Ginsengibacter sp.]